MHNILPLLATAVLVFSIGHSQSTQTMPVKVVSQLKSEMISAINLQQTNTSGQIEMQKYAAQTTKQIIPLADDPSTNAADRKLMAHAYTLAKQAVDHGNHPFSALLVKDGKIIFEYENTIYSTQDVTQHAETGLISQATRQFNRETLANSTLYASTEPCIMCCGAIRWAGIRKVVYGTTSSKLTEVIRQIYPGAANSPLPENPLEIREIFERTEPNIQVYGPVMEAEGIAIHQKYWGKDPILQSIFAKENP
jgi:tRNA(Arg) A34 adenosine deaminase TadA